MTGGISLVDFSSLFWMNGSNGQVDVSMFGSGAEPFPDTPLLNRLVTPMPNRTFKTVFGFSVAVYMRLPLQSVSVVTDSAACMKGAGMLFVRADLLMLPDRCCAFVSASSKRTKYLSVGLVTLILS